MKGSGDAIWGNFMVILFFVLVFYLIFHFFFIPVIITHFAAGLCVLDGGNVVILVFLV
jgi:hypothetical protein